MGERGPRKRRADRRSPCSCCEGLGRAGLAKEMREPGLGEASGQRVGCAGLHHAARCRQTRAPEAVGEGWLEDLGEDKGRHRDLTLTWWWPVRGNAQEGAGEGQRGEPAAGVAGMGVG